MKLYHPFVLLLIYFSVISCSGNESNKIKLIMASNHLRSEDLKQADSVFQTINNTADLDYPYRFVQIILNFKQKNFTESLTNSKHFITKYPKSSLGFYYAGLSEFNLGNYNNAENLFDKGLAIFQNRSHGGYIYFNNYNSQNLFDENSIYNDLIFMIGLNQNLMGKFNSSIKYIQHCLDNNYRNGDALFIMGKNYYELEDKELAKAYFIRAKEEGNADADYYLTE